jgi:hypothetical protein
MLFELDAEGSGVNRPSCRPAAFHETPASLKFPEHSPKSSSPSGVPHFWVSETNKEFVAGFFPLSVIANAFTALIELHAKTVVKIY